MKKSLSDKTQENNGFLLAPVAKIALLPLAITKNILIKLYESIHKMAGGPWDKGPDDGDKGSGPWGKSSDPSSKKPTNIDDTIDLLQRRFKKTFNQGGGGNGGSGGIPEISPFIIALAIAGGLFLWGLTGFYRVQEGELAVVTRFGQMVRISAAGLRYHIPSPIENVIVTKVAAVSTINGGLRDGAEENSDKTLILTGDENMVHTDYTVLWKIKDVTEFLFNARSPEITIKVAAESVIREVIGQTTAKAALTEGRDVIGTTAQALLQRLMDQYKLGIQIVSIQLQSVAPPKEVIESFNGLQASLTDADRLSNEAEAYRNDKIPRAGGEAFQIRADAEGYSRTKVAEAEGEAAQFAQVHAAYLKNPAIALKRIYLAAMDEILANVKEKIIVDPKIGNSVVPYLPLRDITKTAAGDARSATEAGAKK